MALILLFPRVVSVEKKVNMKEQLELRIDAPVAGMQAPDYGNGEEQQAPGR